MANVIYGGVDAFDTIAYGQQDYGSQMFFKSQVEQVSNLLTDYAGQLIILNNYMTGTKVAKLSEQQKLWCAPWVGCFCRIKSNL
jgi:hypothetical protein